MDKKEEIRIISQKQDKQGNVIQQTHECLVDGQYFSRVLSKVCASSNGPRRFTRTIFAKPQENFDCEFGLKMTVKSFSEKRDMNTGRIYERSYIGPMGDEFTRNYLTGQCVYRSPLGTVIRSRKPSSCELLMRMTSRQLDF